MIEQSLCHHLQSQLTEYYRLIAVLESQMSLPLETPKAEGDTGLTLRRLDVWVNEWRLRMRMMSVCVEGARGMFCPWIASVILSSPADAQGGALVNLIHGYTDNGDPFVRKFTDQLLEEVCPPPLYSGTSNLKRGPRYPNHSLPPFTSGSSPANYMIPFLNSLWRWTQNWLTCSTCTPPR
jgi:hypothetical protein